MTVVLAFYAADTLGMTLLEKDGVVWGTDERSVQLGPWEIDLKIRVDSDVLSTGAIGFWVQMSPRLWMYLVVKGTETWLFVFNGVSMGITSKTVDKFGGASVNDTIRKIAPHVKALFYYTEQMKWNKAHMSNLKKWTSK